MTFRDYLEGLPAPYTPTGDFVRLTRTDRKLPDSTSWAELEAHLAARGDSHKTREAGEKVWSDYQRALKHEREL